MQYDHDQEEFWMKIEPKFIFYFKHTVVCLPSEQDVSKYNSPEDVGDKFEMIEANHFWDTDRELNTIWDEEMFGRF
jgi:hypothetical protein